MKKIELRELIFCAILAALGAIFSAYLSVEIPSGGSKLIEMSLAPVFVMLAGIAFGPLLGGMVGFVADIAGFFMGVQHGAYNPVFSFTMALFGVIAGLFFLKNKKVKWYKVLLITVIAQAVCSVGLNTWAIRFFYAKGVPFKALLVPRAIAAGIEVPIYFVLLFALAASLIAIMSKSMRQKSIE